ncbi:periplasmic chaperone for outer membrane proteins SurA [Malonomonas rubra DSM 5091]|uniref:Periplasmic chaperone for outer membrane proteins SurA n=1 Tax=Malonomonas rubra DSM 5091 TaxID=1122189 RepID=A0A1M6IJ13_MALRU|nr:SurA N-terminal domain-containing protein [Malonomonas rubra]SHJ34451.1 periplasmic chaperone for outer membrane proteins SurA [Malonomonas rubra DSM 5091]
MKRFFFLLLLLALLVQPLAAKTLTKVAAVVNNDIITTYQLDKAVIDALAKNAKGNQLTSKEFDQLKTSVLENLINEKLVEQRIKELGLNVPDPELNAAVEDVRLKNNLTADQLKQAVEAQGITFAAYREQLKKEILRYKLLSREVNYKVEVTSGEVRDYYMEHIDEYRSKPKVRVSSLSFELPADEEAVAELREQVVVTRKQLQKGKAFDQVLAAQGDAAFGGDMGYLVEDDLAAVLREALGGLEVGQVSEPVEMNNQLHLFLITERDSGDSGMDDRVKAEIEQLLHQQKTEARFKEWAAELRENGYIDIRI